MNDRIQQLEHFLRLARRGRNPAASGGERRAWMLAEAVAEHAAGLDASAVAGLLDFVKLAAARPCEADELLGQADDE